MEVALSALMVTIAMHIFLTQQRTDNILAPKLEEIQTNLGMYLNYQVGSNKLLPCYLNNNSQNKLEKPIKNYLDLFINTRLNHMSIRSQH